MQAWIETALKKNCVLCSPNQLFQKTSLIIVKLWNIKHRDEINILLRSTSSIRLYSTICVCLCACVCPDGRQSGQFILAMLPRAGPLWFCLSSVPIRCACVSVCVCVELTCPRAKMSTNHNRQTDRLIDKKKERNWGTDHRKEKGPPCKI